MAKYKKHNRFYLSTRFNPFQIIEGNISSYSRAVSRILNKDSKTALSEDLKAIKKDGEKAIKKHQEELESCLCL